MRKALKIIDSIYEKVKDLDPRVKEFLGQYINYAIAKELRHNFESEIHRLISELIAEINSLEEKEGSFIIDHLEDFGKGLQHNHQEYFNLLELYDKSNCNDLNGFALYLLNKCCEEDDYKFISYVSSPLRGNLPESREIEDILIKSILGKSKSDSLRKRFLDIFILDCEDESKKFFKNKLEQFFKDNFENIELNAEIIQYALWNIEYLEDDDAEKIKDIINRYLAKKPEVKELIVVTATREILGI